MRNFKKKDFILFIFRQRVREGEREGEKHQCVVASHVAPTGDLARNPGMPLGMKPVTFWFAAHAQSTELHQPGLISFLSPRSKG